MARDRRSDAKTWTFDDLQWAADELYKIRGLAVLDKIVCSHASREQYDAARQAEFSGCPNLPAIPVLCSAGLPDNWFIYVYGDQLFGVDPIARTVARISPVWLLSEKMPYARS